MEIEKEIQKIFHTHTGIIFSDVKTEPPFIVIRVSNDPYGFDDTMLGRFKKAVKKELDIGIDTINWSFNEPNVLRCLVWEWL